MSTGERYAYLTLAAAVVVAALLGIVLLVDHGWFKPRTRRQPIVTDGRKADDDATEDSLLETFGEREIRSHRAPSWWSTLWAKRDHEQDAPEPVQVADEPPPAVDPFSALASLPARQIHWRAIGRVTLTPIGEESYAIGPPHWRNPLTAVIAARQLASVAEPESDTGSFEAIVGTRLTSKGPREADLTERRVVRAEEPFDPSRAYQPSLWPVDEAIRGEHVPVVEVTGRGRR